MNSPRYPLAMRATLLAAAGLLAGSACAQTYTFKIGGGHINPRATSSDLQGTLPTHVSALPLVAAPAGNQLEVQSKEVLLFSVSRSLDEHWSVELMLGLPPEHDVKLRVGTATKQAAQASAATLPALVAKGVAGHVAQYDGQVVAKVKQSAPTLFVNYRFDEVYRNVRPYVGIGLNYTRFKATANQAGTELYEDGPVRISLTDSYGPAFQAGLSYAFDKQWLAQVGWATAAVKNNMTIRTNTSEQKASYRFHPSMFSLMVGYQY